MSKLRGPAIQWYFKQWLGDQKVLGMDWDANGMHFWLINLSLQEDPAGTIPNDLPLIRRWLHNPSDEIWRRVQPQIFSAWSLADGRWHQKGAVEAAQRQVAYSGARKAAAEQRWKGAAHAMHMQYEKGTETQKTKTKEEVVVDLEFIGPSFEEIYEEYPRKLSKGSALRAIQKAQQRLVKGEHGVEMSPADANSLLLHCVKEWAKSPAGQQGGYTPYPATWFNGSRYLDDQAEWMKQGKGGGNVTPNRSQQRVAGNLEALRIADEREERDQEAASDFGGDAPGGREPRDIAGLLGGPGGI